MATNKPTKKKGVSKKTAGKKKPKPRGKTKTKRGLTQIQEELAQEYILCQGNQSEAYRKVYPNSKATPKGLWSLASRAFSDSKVQIRIAELQDLATQKHVVTVETITEELDASYKMAKDLKQPGHMTGSSNVKAKLHGLMIEQHKHSGNINLTGLSEEELNDIINGNSSP